MNKTPRTDAEIRFKVKNTEYVEANFAKQLELENNELRKELEEYKKEEYLRSKWDNGDTLIYRYEDWFNTNSIKLKMKENLVNEYIWIRRL